MAGASMRWALALLAAAILHSVSTATSFKNAWVERCSITHIECEIEKPGRGRKSHPCVPLLLWAALRPRPLSPSLRSVRGQSRTPRGWGRVIPHVAGSSSASAQSSRRRSLRVPVALLFLTSFLKQPPASGRTGRPKGRRQGRSPAC